jgi:hypothetical protein
VQTDNGDSVIVIPSSGGVMRYGAGLFLLCWLGGWSFAIYTAGTQFLYGKNAGSAFVLFWLGAALLAEVFVIYQIYRIFRPPVPESLRLKRNSLVYDSGIPPYQMSYRRYRYADQKEAWKAMFPRRTITEIDRRQLDSLRLRETDSGNRLTVDANASRLDLASTASEIEREWLYKLLASRYALSSSGTSA